MKICISCGEKKEIEDYSLHSSTGKRSKVCIFCSKKKKKENDKRYYQKNKKRIIEQHREYVGENKEKVKKLQKEYRENNKEDIKEYKKKYAKKNKEVCAQTVQYSVSIGSALKIQSVKTPDRSDFPFSSGYRKYRCFFTL